MLDTIRESSNILLLISSDNIEFLSLLFQIIMITNF